MSERKYIRLEEIIDSGATEDLYIEELEEWVKIKNARTLDRMEAEVEARKHPAWDKLTPLEQAGELGRCLARKIIVEPKIDFDTYLKSDYYKISIILDAVSAYYAKKITSLTDKRKEEITSFLEVQKEKGVESS